MTSRSGHQHPGYSGEAGAFQSSYHLEMIRDAARTGVVRRALDSVLTPESVFCDLGCGTGIFALHAAKTCRKVYAVEFDPQMVAAARRNFRRSPHADRIELIEGDALSTTLPEAIDVAVCEMMSIWCFHELQIPVANHARTRLLKPGGSMLPGRIVNLAALGWYPFDEEGVELRSVMPLFTGVLKPAVMTEQRVCGTLDFSEIVDERLDADVAFESFAAGAVNCAVLHSVVEFAPGAVFSGTDSLMPPTVVPLAEDVRVKPGDVVRLEVRGHARQHPQDVEFKVVPN